MGESIAARRARSAPRAVAAPAAALCRRGRRRSSSACNPRAIRAAAARDGAHEDLRRDRPHGDRVVALRLIAAPTEPGLIINCLYISFYTRGERYSPLFALEDPRVDAALGLHAARDALVAVRVDVVLTAFTRIIGRVHAGLDDVRRE